MSNEKTAINSDDAEFADRFVRQHSDKLRYIHEERAWFAWDGTRWAKNGAKPYELARQTADSILDEIKDHSDKHDRDQLYEMATRYRNTGPIDQALKQVREKLGNSITKFDTDPETINCKNGVLNLRTGVLIKHDPSQLMLKCTNVDYNPAAKCDPTWLKFLDEIFERNRELISYKQQALGYSLTGLCREHCFFILYGTGHNGKGTFAETVLEIMGDYAGITQMEVLTNRDKSNVRVLEEVGLLKGRRFTLASETDGNARLSEGLIKRVTGGDTLTGTKLHGGRFEFKPAHKLWLQVNHLPAIKDATKGMWRRVRVTPFNVNFEIQNDGQLREKLLKKKEVIFAWMVEGAILYFKAGKLPELPEIMKEAIKDYSYQSDNLRQFIEDCLVPEKGAKIGSEETFMAYEAWCDSTGRGIDDRTSSQYFRQNMGERDIRCKLYNKSKQYATGGWKFLDYRLKTDKETVAPTEQQEQKPAFGNGKDATTFLQEWDQYKNMTPEQREQETKRVMGELDQKYTGTKPRIPW